MLYDEKMAFSYLDNLFKELDSYHIDKVATIYVGGGTPSALNDDLFERLLKQIQPYLAPSGEFTVEANVEQLSAVKLILMRRYGVNRLSIGAQSTDDEMLKNMNRKHTFSDVQKAVEQARGLGFNNINLDLIYGVPSQSETMLRTDIKRLLELNPEHLSVYSLTIHPGTIFYQRGCNEQNEDDSRRHYDIILEELRRAGYIRYEVSNFAKPGHMARHNLTYWRNEPYYGVGLGAAGFLGGVRYENTRNMSKYLQGVTKQGEERLSKEEDEKYFWMLNLRLEDGFAISEYVRRYGEQALADRLAIFRDTIKAGLMLKSNGRIRLSDDGLMILDRILLLII
jgi:oxygen-independent coproporphyrinogen-3 oxidase